MGHVLFAAALFLIPIALFRFLMRMNERLAESRWRYVPWAGALVLWLAAAWILITNL